MWSNRISASQQHRRLMSTWCFGFDVNPIFISNWISNSSQQVGVDWFWRQADFQFVFQLKFECRLNIWCYLGGFPHCISLDAFFRSPHGLFTCTQPKPTQNVIVQNLVPCRECARIKLWSQPLGLQPVYFDVSSPQTNIHSINPMKPNLSFTPGKILVLNIYPLQGKKKSFRDCESLEKRLAAAKLKSASS